MACLLHCLASPDVAQQTSVLFHLSDLNDVRITCSMSSNTPYPLWPGASLNGEYRIQSCAVTVSGVYYLRVAPHCNCWINREVKSVIHPTHPCI